MLYALAAAVGWGVACGLLRAPFWAVVVGGLAAAALSLWLEWEPLGGRAQVRRPNFHLMLATAYVFLALVGVGLVSVGYFMVEWLAFRLHGGH